MRTLTQLTTLLLFGLALFPSTAPAYELNAFSGKSRAAKFEEITPKLDAAENKGNKFYSEQYSFDANPAGNTDFWFQLVISNMGLQNGRAGLQVHLKPQGQKKIKTRQFYSRDKWSHSVDGGKLKFTLGDNWIEGDLTGWKGHFINDQFEADFTITNGPPAWRPGGGAVYYGKGKKSYYDVTLLTPRGTVEVTATLKATGEKVSISGPIYGDRSVSNISPALQSKKWIRMRRIGRRRTVMLTTFQSHEQYEGKWVGWFVSSSKKRVEAVGVNPKVELGELEKDAKSGYQVPKSILFSDAKGLEGFVGAIKALKLRRSENKLSSLSKLERAIVSKLVKPFSFTYKAAYEFQYEKGGKTRTRKGKVSYHYEQMNP